jgi:hypothetical protein
LTGAYDFTLVWTPSPGEGGLMFRRTSRELVKHALRNSGFLNSDLHSPITNLEHPFALQNDLPYW